MLRMVKMPLKREVGGHALTSHGNFIVDHGKSWESHGIVSLNFCGNPAAGLITKNVLPHMILWIFLDKTEHEKTLSETCVVLLSEILNLEF